MTDFITEYKTLIIAFDCLLAGLAIGYLIGEHHGVKAGMRQAAQILRRSNVHLKNWIK